jgi:hypothetical protein
MMTTKHKMTVITDKAGKFLGAVRSGEIKDGATTLRFHALPNPDHKHHEIEVDDALMSRPLDEVRKALTSQTARY